jgi:hypothetical protein
MNFLSDIKVKDKKVATEEFVDKQIESAMSGGSGGATTVDSQMSDTSTNPVQNKVVKNYVDNISPEYSDTSSLTTLSSGEKLTNALSKIKLAISNLINHINNKSNPHEISKSQIGLGYVENKSSATIRGELTKKNVTDALGYTPPESSSSYTHPTYTAKSSGLYKVTVDETGHVSSTSAVTKSDITGLGIPSTNTTYSNFVKSGTGAASGLVPAPSTTSGTTKYLREDGTWAVPPDTNSDTKVTSTETNPTSGTNLYPAMISGATTGGVVYNDGFKVYLTRGTSSSEGFSSLSVGNATATGSAGNEYGRINLYSVGTSYGQLRQSETDDPVTHWLPATGGAILNVSTTSYTPTLTSGNVIGKIKINNNETVLYAPDHDNDYLSLSGGTISLSSFAPLTIERSGSSQASGIKFTNSNGTLGYIGMANNPDSGLCRWGSNIGTPYTVLDTGNAFTTTTPKALAATASVGSASTVSRSDHVHPLSTTNVTAGSYGPSSNASPAHSGTFSVPYITVDKYGRVTSASTKTITLPAASGGSVSGDYLPLSGGTLTGALSINNNALTIGYQTGSAPYILLNRDTYANWKILSQAGSFKIQTNYSPSNTKLTSFADILTFSTGGGTATLKSSVLSISGSIKATGKQLYNSAIDYPDSNTPMTISIAGLSNYSVLAFDFLPSQTGSTGYFGVIPIGYIMTGQIVNFYPSAEKYMHFSKSSTTTLKFYTDGGDNWSGYLTIYSLL